MVEFMASYGKADGKERVFPAHLGYHIPVALGTLAYLYLCGDEPDHFMPPVLPSDTPA